jgi:mono/diheme cytochrome c family protein
VRTVFAPFLLLLTVFLSSCGGASTEAPRALPNQLLASSTSTADYATVVQQLYVSYFGRPADSGGFANFKSRMVDLKAPTDIQDLTGAYKTNAGLRDLIDSFGSSDESKALYSGDTATFVTAIYTNVLGRAPDTEGRNFWAGEIDKGNLTRANASLAIMAGALNNTSTQGLSDAALVRNRVTVANYFSNALVGSFATAYSGAAAAATARSMLSTVNGSTNTTAFQATVTSTLTTMATPVKGPLFTPVAAIIKSRCASCHSASTTNPLYPVAAVGIELDTSAQIRAEASRIFQVSVLTSTMPSGGPALTSAERATITTWINAGAPE